MKLKKILLLLLLGSSIMTDFCAEYYCEGNELSKFVCRCECFHVDYVETCLILFLIIALVYTRYKLSKSETRQKWMRKNFNIDNSKELKNAI